MCVKSNFNLIAVKIHLSNKVCTTKFRISKEEEVVARKLGDWEVKIIFKNIMLLKVYTKTNQILFCIITYVHIIFWKYCQM